VQSPGRRYLPGIPDFVLALFEVEVASALALFINVDPVPAKWWKRKVHRGWQFGYSGGTENDFMIDIEIAKWRFACYIGMKKVQNWAPGYEKHLKWRKEQEDARKRANKSESARPVLQGRRSYQATANRMDQKQSFFDHTSAFARFVVAPIRKLRLFFSKNDYYDQDGFKLATRPSLPEPIHGDAATPFKGVILYEEHQRKSPDDTHHKDPEAGGLSEGAD
jgi:hypothetical protein